MSNIREYKFRGQRVSDKEWVYGLPKYGSGGNINYICGWMGENDNPLYDEVPVIPETVGQLLANYDNKDLYEWDVIEFDIAKNKPIVIKYKNGAIAYWSIFDFKHKFNIIGNIFTHPHLIEQ